MSQIKDCAQKITRSTKTELRFNNGSARYIQSSAANVRNQFELLPTPIWLLGWWDVQDSGQYYFYFGPSGCIQYSTVRPIDMTSPLKSPSHEGEFSILANSTILIRWGDIETSVLEKFINAKPESATLKGIGISGALMTATKIFNTAVAK